MGRDMYGPMNGASAWMMRGRWDAPHLALLWLMWAVMMAAMMLPSAYPVLVMYGVAARARGLRAGGQRPLHPYALVIGYLLVWAGFSLGATVLQWLLTRLLMLSPMMEVTSARAGAVVLLVAGIYQFTSIKLACLGVCRSPMAMLMQGWHEGRAGAVRMGIAHGAHCVGCCWALMLLLFVGGVMNLAVIGALTLLVAFEKLGPYGERGARVSGALLVAIGAWMLVR
jgi:predicted metal-binding membrane protein